MGNPSKKIFPRRIYGNFDHQHNRHTHRSMRNRGNVLSARKKDPMEAFHVFPAPALHILHPSDAVEYSFRRWQLHPASFLRCLYNAQRDRTSPIPCDNASKSRRRLNRKDNGTRNIRHAHGNWAAPVIGAPLAYLLVRNHLPPETWKAFGILAGSWIGGTGNMAAVAGGLEVGDSPQFGLAVLGDNVVYIVWLPILLASKCIAKPFHRFVKIDHHRIEILESVNDAVDEKAEPVAMRHFLYLFAIGFACIWVANTISDILPELGPVLTASTWKILLITTMGLILSRTPARKIPASHELAMALVYIFVANMGAKADLSQLDSSVGWFILACFIWISIHGAFCLLGAYLFKVDIHSTAIASAANIGGAASAPIIAAHHNKKLVPVSILMALIGYAVGNYGAFLTALLCSLISPQI